MNQEALEALAQKVANKKATPEEALLFLKEFNKLLESLKTELKQS